MFGLSTWELLIIVAVALIFVGPDQLPKVARTIGKGMRQVRGAMGKVDDEMRKAVREVSAELDDEGEPLREAPYRSPLAPLETASKAAEPHAAPTNASDASGGPDHAPDATGVQVVQDAVNQTPPADTPRQDVEVQTSRRGANRTMAERDWSEVGRQPIAGRVAQGSPPSTSPTPSPEATAPDEATPPGAPAAEKPTA